MTFTQGMHLSAAAFHIILRKVCRLVFNSIDSSFIRLSDLETEKLLALCDDHKQCLACGFKERKSNFTDSRACPNGFSRNDVNYHVGEFIYVSTGFNQIYQIGQIEHFRLSKGKCVEVITRMFGRYDDIVRDVCRGVDKPKGISYDEVRTLYMHSDQSPTDLL